MNTVQRLEMVDPPWGARQLALLRRKGAPDHHIDAYIKKRIDAGELRRPPNAANILEAVPLYPEFDRGIDLADFVVVYPKRTARKPARKVPRKR